MEVIGVIIGFIALCITVYKLLSSKKTIIKFHTETGGKIFKYSDNPEHSQTALLFNVNIRVVSNISTQLHSAELRLIKDDVESKLRFSHKPELTVLPKLDFNLPKDEQKEVALYFIFMGILEEKYYKGIEEAIDTDSDGIITYLRLQYFKDGEDKFTQFKEIVFYKYFINRTYPKKKLL